MKKNQWMKKSCAVVVAMVSMFAICGCGNKADKLKPYEWIMGGDVVSYYHSAEEVDEDVCRKYDSYFDGAQSDSTTWVLVNEDSEIRAFFTEDSSVVTYKGISVGDALSVVEDTFSYDVAFGDSCYMVCFDGETEINTEEAESEDDWILISYFAEEGMITYITVHDSVFGSSLK